MNLHEHQRIHIHNRSCSRFASANSHTNLGDHTPLLHHDDFLLGKSPLSSDLLVLSCPKTWPFFMLFCRKEGQKFGLHQTLQGMILAGGVFFCRAVLIVALPKSSCSLLAGRCCCSGSGSSSTFVFRCLSALLQIQNNKDRSKKRGSGHLEKVGLE